MVTGEVTPELLVDGLAYPSQRAFQALDVEAACNGSQGRPEAAGALALYAKAVGLVVAFKMPAASWLQQQLRTNHDAAAFILTCMEQDGFVSASDRAGRREVLDNANTQAVREALLRAGKPPRPEPATTESFEAAQPDVLTATAQGRLKSFVERIERLETDKAEIAADMKEVYAEAKGEGFDVKIIRKVVRLRRTHKVKRQEEEALVDLYLSAIGGL